MVHKPGETTEHFVDLCSLFFVWPLASMDLRASLCVATAFLDMDSWVKLQQSDKFDRYLIVLLVLESKDVNDVLGYFGTLNKRCCNHGNRCHIFRPSIRTGRCRSRTKSCSFVATVSRFFVCCVHFLLSLILKFDLICRTLDERMDEDDKKEIANALFNFVFTKEASAGTFSSL